MAHFRTKWQAVPVLPRSTSGKFRMQRLPEGTSEGRGEREFGAPPCVADWDGWIIVSDPVDPAPGDPVTYTITPAPTSVLCEGDCLEWSQETDCAGLGVSIEPAEDCVGVIVTVDAKPDSECAITLNATLNGSSFGNPVVIAYGCVVDWESWEFPDGDTFPAEPGDYSGVTRTLVMNGQNVGDCLPEIDWSSWEWSGDPDHVLQYEIGTPIRNTSDQIEIPIFLWDPLGGSLAGAALTLNPRYDPGSGLTAFGDPVIFTCEE